MASAKCNDLVTRLNDAKNKANQAFEQLGRIKGLIAQTENQAELVELEERRLDISQLANEAARYADALLQQAKQFNCGPDIESKINAELNYARNVFNQISTLGGELARKINDLGRKRKQEADAKAAAEAAKDSQKATTTQDNAGTGKPGSAGTGPAATPAPAPSPTTITGPTGPAGASAGSGTGATGPQPVVDDPAIPTDAGPIEDIGLDPNINLGEDPPQPEGSSQGLEGEKDATIQTASRQDAINYARAGDWRVRLALAPNAKYIYDLPDGESPGILAPLRATDGVIFPYTPNISIAYAASYDPTNITHSNYKIFQYQYSSVDNISISCDFTAQDTYEANYLLAVIHFFRTVTKMFYGQDQNPKAGTPPPLCYLYGLGQFQFNAHPLVITNFTYNLPTDVDYIRATSIVSAGQSVAGANIPNNTTPNPSNDRLSSSQNKVQPGGVSAQPNFSATPPSNIEPTYVPTKILIQINAVPIVSRNDISKRFSIKDYATGKLLNGKDNPTMGGIW